MACPAQIAQERRAAAAGAGDRPGEERRDDPAFGRITSGVIHADFQRGYIKAEIVSHDQLL